MPTLRGFVTAQWQTSKRKPRTVIRDFKVNRSRILSHGSGAAQAAIQHNLYFKLR